MGVAQRDTTIIRIPRDQDLIIILDNAMQRRYVDQMSQAILGVLYGVPPALKPPVGEILRRMLRTHDIADVISKYGHLRRAHPNDYDFSDYRSSWNAYDSLGEAYRDAGDIRDSILCYKRSLEVNPDSINAIKVLRELLHS